MPSKLGFETDGDKYKKLDKEMQLADRAWELIGQTVLTIAEDFVKATYTDLYEIQVASANGVMIISQATRGILLYVYAEVHIENYEISDNFSDKNILSKTRAVY